MFTIKFSPTAAKDYKKLQKPLVSRILAGLKEISTNPFSSGIPLKGVLKGKYKFRVGDHRILYLILKEDGVVVIINIGHRKDVYRG